MIHISRVRAVAFGAIVDRTMELHDGLTVVFGANGSGKSTWHAALYAALAGHPPVALMTDDDQEFERERRPIGGTDWQVQAEFCLNRRQRTELTQDLDARSVNGGSTRDLWQRMRLDRYSYAATAWIEQADGGSTPGALRRNTISSAARAFVREDAALSAIHRIQTWRREIGEPGSGGPLDQIRTRYHELLGQAQALRALQERRAVADEALRAAEAAVTTAERRLRAAEAAAAWAEVRRIQAKIDALGTAEHWSTGYQPFAYGPTPEQKHERVEAAEMALTAADGYLSSLGLVPPVPTIGPQPAVGPPLIGGPRPTVAPPPRRYRLVPATAAAVFLVVGLVLAGFGQLVSAAMSGAVAAIVAGIAFRRRPSAIDAPDPAERETLPPPIPPPPPRTVEREQATRGVDEALTRLAAALTDAGYETGSDGARATDERYRADRLAAEKAAEERQLRWSVERDELGRELALAQTRTDERAVGFTSDEIAAAWPTGFDREEMDRAGLAWLQERQDDYERACAELPARQATAAELARQEAITLAAGDPVARCEQALARHERWEDMNAVLDEASKSLVRARRDTLREVAKAIDGNLFDFLPVITDMPRVSATMGPDFELHIAEPAWDAGRPGPGSNSTRRLARLFARVALGTFVVRQGGEAGPLLLDEPSGRANGPRMHRVLDKLLEIASWRQVVVFTADHAVRGWAQAHQPKVRLLWLAGVDACPEPYRGQDLLDSESEG